MNDIYTRHVTIKDYDPYKEYNCGDIVLMDGEILVCTTSNVFEPIVTYDASSNDSNQSSKNVTPIKCNCCGGSLIRYRSGYICEYCDTEYA